LDWFQPASYSSHPSKCPGEHEPVGVSATTVAFTAIIILWQRLSIAW
jgi:hypothetical protein